MAKSSATVKRRRDKMRAMGLRPIQIWVVDVKAPGFAEECARQCRLINKFETTPEGREEAEWWDKFTAESWADLEPYG
jgi:hypothetical protein